MFLCWENLVCGFSLDAPLHEPFSGQLESSGIYAIIGANGSGKSTLLRTWLGLLPPLAGTCCLGHCGCQHNESNFPCVGYVPQYHAVNKYFHISVEDLIRQGYMRLSRKPNQADEVYLQELLKAWDLFDVATKSFHEISGGQKTRALVARALVSKPSLMFLDEPLASLDVHCQLFLVESLANLAREQNLCVVIVDHHLANFEHLLSGKFIFARKHYTNICEINYTPGEPRLPNAGGLCSCSL